MSSRISRCHSRCQVTFEEPVTTDNSLCCVQVSVEEISKILSSLDVLKTIGPDKLPTIVLKECAESLAPSVTAVVNFGLRTGLQLTEWSLLGPILFLLFVNDMPRVVENAKLAMFADDSKCFKVIYQESDGVSSLCHVV